MPHAVSGKKDLSYCLSKTPSICATGHQEPSLSAPYESPSAGEELIDCTDNHVSVLQLQDFKFSLSPAVRRPDYIGVVRKRVWLPVQLRCIVGTRRLRCVGIVHGMILELIGT